MEFINDLTNLSYLLAAVLFIVGLKRLSSPATARSGNLLGATAMLIAVVVTLIDREVLDYAQIGAGMIVGAAAGAVLARTIKMTAMPQMVAIFNGLGGGASALVASGEFHKLTSGSDGRHRNGRWRHHHAGHLHWRSHPFGKPHSLWKAPGDSDLQRREFPDHKGLQPGPVPGYPGHNGLSGCNCGGFPRIPGAYRPGAAAWHSLW